MAATALDCPPPSAVDAPADRPNQPHAESGRAATDRVRVRFRKGGDLRLLSHHDLLRCFERIFRRAALPVHLTKGFNPHPRFVFALSLPLGVVGCAEVMDLELDEVLPTDEVHQRLAHQCPPGLAIASVERVPLKVSLQVRSLSYRLAIPADRVADLRQRIVTTLSAETLPVVRTKTQPSADAQGPAERHGPQVDLRPFLRDLRITELSNEHALEIRSSPHAPREGAALPHAEREDYYALEIDLWLTPAGTAKPVEVLGLLGLMDLVDAGTVIERSRLELQDNASETSEVAKTSEV